MCDTCGCNATPIRTIPVGERLLAQNDDIAAHNRTHFAACDVTAVNLMGTPGAGKTALLEATIIRGNLRIAVIEGDQATQRDSARITAAGAPVYQIETGTGCHLDAQQVHQALDALPLHSLDLLVIENVGNLVCPALFDLGEHRRIVVTSPPEGTDKPLKYPSMFRTADLIVLNKSDLLPHVPFDLDAWRRYVGQINSDARVVLTSALTGSGLTEWLALLTTFAAHAPRTSEAAR